MDPVNNNPPGPPNNINFNAQPIQISSNEGESTHTLNTTFNWKGKSYTIELKFAKNVQNAPGELTMDEAKIRLNSIVDKITALMEDLKIGEKYQGFSLERSAQDDNGVKLTKYKNGGANKTHEIKNSDHYIQEKTQKKNTEKTKPTSGHSK